MERTNSSTREIISKLRDQNMSYQRIADKLIEMGIPTVRNKTWHKSSVWQIVRRDQQ